MTSRVFETSLKACQIRQPFRAFVIELVSGSEIMVQHPEAVVTQSGAAVFFSTDGGITLFDAEGVSRLSDLRKEPTSA
jgi:hypothetical protein